MENKQTAVALGSFDGLHKGHKSVLTCALSCRERGFVPCALLFDTHPLLALCGSAPDEILQSSVRSRMLAEMGVEEKSIDFLSVMNMSPEEFFAEVIVSWLNAGAVCCGENYRFGSHAAGDVNTLRALCEKSGIELITAPTETYMGETISSTRIREAITRGDIEAANAMLGYEFCYEAVVVHGSRRGHIIGAPTVNQYFDKGFIVPKTGVYASRVSFDGNSFTGITNIGLRPSFENEDLRSETHIPGFYGDLYGLTVKISLLGYIRGERRFDGMDSLRAQIALDTQRAFEIYDRGDINV